MVEMTTAITVTPTTEEGGRKKWNTHIRENIGMNTAWNMAKIEVIGEKSTAS